MKHLQYPINLIVDLHALGGALTGKHYYTLGLLDALSNHQMARHIQFHLVSTTTLPSITIDNATWHYFSKLQYYPKLSLLTKTLPNARLLSPTSFIPPLTSFCPTITIVYDTASITPQSFARNQKARVLESLLISHVLKQAAHVVTISQAVAQELAQVNKMATAKLLVIYPLFRDFPKPDLKDIESMHLNPNGYFLYIGTLEPRKNLVNLIAAYAEFLRHTNKLNPPKLVIAGQKGWHYTDIFAAINTEALRKMIVIIDSPTDRQLSGLYTYCLCFCYASHYEGFGMPVLEAMSFSKAVLTSDSAVFNEVAGSSAIYVDQSSVVSITQGLQELYENDSLRHQLESHTKNQVKKLDQSEQMNQFIYSLLGTRDTNAVK